MSDPQIASACSTVINFSPDPFVVNFARDNLYDEPPDARDLPAIAELAESRQWVNWRAVERDGRVTKVPVRPPVKVAFGAGPRRVINASTTDRTSWGDFDCACFGRGRGYGLGFVFTPDDPYLGIDLDNCFDGDGKLKDWAAGVIDRIESYAERSPSSSGLHIICKARWQGAGTKVIKGDGAIEVYDRGRYFTVTGHHYAGTPLEIRDAQAAIDILNQELARRGSERNSVITATPAQQTPSDESVIKKARLTSANFGTLFDLGVVSAFGNDHSKADFALCGMLANVTADKAQIERIFNLSPLARRAKWQDREDYRERTINKATANVLQSGSDRLADGGDNADRTDGPLSAFADIELFHDDQRVAYAAVPVGGRIETFRVQSKGMAQWVTHRLSKTTNKVVSATTRADLIAVIEAKAVYDSPQQNVAIRVASAGENIYLDLADVAGTVIEVTPSGWKATQSTPVKFVRPEGMLPLPMPVAGGTLDELRPLVNLPDENSWILVVAWLVGAMHPKGPYPALGVNGQQGSAKTTLCTLLRRLIDPNTAPLRSRPKSEQDTIIAAANSRILAFDNLSFIDGDLSDILCRISTGSGYSTRRLYTNDEEQLFMLSRPILFNGIDELATRPDLLQRTLSIDLKPVATRRRLSDVDGAFDRLHPCLLGALLTAVSTALANHNTVVLNDPPRMADFAAWVTAALPALGWAPDVFERAMASNQQAGATLAVDVDVVGTGIVKMMQTKEQWEGRMAELLEAARQAAGRYEDSRFHEPKGWPANPTAMSNRVRKVVEPLRACGIQVEVNGAGDSGRARKVRIINTSYKQPPSRATQGYVEPRLPTASRPE